MKKVSIRGAYDYDVDAASAAAALVIPEGPEESRTQQSFKDECDINVIVERFGLTGEMPGDLKMPVSGDFTGVTDFHSAMNLVVEAQDQFMRLPAEVRKRFGHDPAELIAFLGDEKNKDEAIKLGLVNPPAEVPRDAVKAIDELAAKLAPPVAKP